MQKIYHAAAEVIGEGGHAAELVALVILDWADKAIAALVDTKPQAAPESEGNPLNETTGHMRTCTCALCKAAPG